MAVIHEKDLQTIVAKAVREVKVTDIHTHLYDPAFSHLLLKGVDELLTYHYLVAETFRWTNLSYAAFWELPKPRQAELVWKACFLDHGPVSEACRGVLKALQRLGLDTLHRDLGYYRQKLSSIPSSEYLNRVFEIAGVREVVMTNDPLDEAERPLWEKGFKRDPRFKAGLRIDLLLLAWDKTWPRVKALGYKVGKKLTPLTLKELRRFLFEWADRFKALYLMVSLPPTFAYPDKSPTSSVLVEAVLPVCRQLNKPFAMMIGVKRQVNPELRLAGDGVGWASAEAVEQLCRDFPQNKFMATMLSRENQHSLAVAGRKFRNLMVYGCWWFVNVPSLVEEITQMRMELMGNSFIPQHSDARVLDQLIYKWDVAREAVTKVLTLKYKDLSATGWAVKEEEIRRDVEGLFSGNFYEFIQRK